MKRYINPRSIFPVPYDQLNALLAFDHLGSVAEAAKALGVSQPAISNLLARLEAKYAQPLFSKNGGRKVLTVHGRALLTAVGGPLGDLAAAFDHFQRLYRNPAERKIRLAGRREILQRLSGKLRFAGTLEFMILPGDQVIEALRWRHCDLGIVQRPVTDEDLAQFPLFDTKVVLAVPKTFPSKAVHQEKFLTEEFFARQPFIAYREPHPFVEELSKNLKRDLTPRRVVRICPDWELVAKMVSGGQGFTIMPEDFAAKVRNGHIFNLSPAFLAPVRFNVLGLRTLMAVPGLNDFLAELRNAFKPETAG